MTRRKIRVWGAADGRPLGIRIHPDRKNASQLYVEAPKYFVLDHESAFALANTLVDLAEALPDKDPE